MARTAQQVLESTIGQLHIQVCSLQAALDDANEKAETLKKALDSVKSDASAKVPHLVAKEVAG